MTAAQVFLFVPTDRLTRARTCVVTHPRVTRPDERRARGESTAKRNDFISSVRWSTDDDARRVGNGVDFIIIVIFINNRAPSG